MAITRPTINCVTTITRPTINCVTNITTCDSPVVISHHSLIIINNDPILICNN